MILSVTSSVVGSVMDSIIYVLSVNESCDCYLVDIGDYKAVSSIIKKILLEECSLLTDIMTIQWYK